MTCTKCADSGLVRSGVGGIAACGACDAYRRIYVAAVKPVPAKPTPSDPNADTTRIEDMPPARPQRSR